MTRYAVSEDGSTSGTCTNAADPCTLEAALDASGASDNDHILVRIRRVGETATIGDATKINKMVTLGVYVRGTSAAAKGAVNFTGSVEMADGGSLMTHKDASVRFDEIEIAGMASVDKLTISDDLTISEDDEDNSMTSSPCRGRTDRQQRPDPHPREWRRRASPTDERYCGQDEWKIRRQGHH